MHVFVSSVLFYYKYYPLIYVFVCAYHVYSYYEYTKVISHFIKLMIGKKKLNIPIEQDYEWVFIDENLLELEEQYKTILK